MQVTPVAADSAANAQSALRRPVTQEQFLQLLVTQLQHQDPLHPQDDTTMLAQLAQFSALEQMKAIAQAGQQARAGALLGRTVAGAAPTGEVTAGKVAAVNINGDSLELQLQNGATVDAASVVRVSQ